VAARSKSSSRWLKEHFSDVYVKQAQAQGLRSRAAFKLEELLEDDLKIRPGMTVVDLGAAPGSWSQMAVRWLKGKGRVIATDILPMEQLEGVEFLQGDFTDELVLAKLEAMLDGQKVDLVLSDMAPNMSGMHGVDIPKSLYLAELAAEFAQAWLKPGGTYLVKLFQGTGTDEHLKLLRGRYTKVNLRKPAASRSRSREIYAMATGKRV
jgi:23S rRNA (uridine2552-2'-O)-methyltransferase